MLRGAALGRRCRGPRLEKSRGIGFFRYAPKEKKKEPWENQENRDKFNARMPHDDPTWHPTFRKIMAGADKVVMPGAGENWLTKTLGAETMDLIYSNRSWHRLNDPYNRIRQFTLKGIASSDVVRRLIYPDLAFVGMCSMLLTTYNTSVPTGKIIPGLHKTYSFELHDNMFVLPYEHSLILSTAIGLLVTIRTAAAYGRYKEARVIWSSVVSNSRELCGRIIARVPTPRRASVREPYILVARDLGARLAWTFPHALRYHVHATGCNTDLDPKKKRLDQTRQRFREDLKMIWDFDNKEQKAVVDRLLHRKTTHWPLHVCQELTHLNATWYVAPHAGGLGHPNSEGIDGRITAMQQVIADSERIIQTPIYTPYTRFTNRIIMMFLCTLPPVFFPILGPWFTTPTIVFVSFVFLGIDDIARRVELPFDNLPLWQFCETVDSSCKQILKNSAKFEKSPVVAREDRWAIGWSPSAAGLPGMASIPQ